MVSFLIKIHEIIRKCVFFYQITEKIFKKRADFGKEHDYIEYMKSVLQPGVRVKALYSGWYSGFSVKSGDKGTVTSSVFRDWRSRDCVKLDFDTGSCGGSYMALKCGVVVLK